MSIKKLHICDICGKEALVPKDGYIFLDTETNVKISAEFIKNKKKEVKTWLAPSDPLRDSDMNPFWGFGLGSSSYGFREDEPNDLELCNKCWVKVLGKVIASLNVELV